MKNQITSTPVRTDKDLQQAVEELRRQCRALVDTVTTLEGKVAALETKVSSPPAT